MALGTLGACGSGSPMAACGDGEDNDRDGRIDLQDAGCVGDPRQTSEADPRPDTTSSTVRFNTVVDTPPVNPVTTRETLSCQVNGLYEETGVNGSKSFSGRLEACETAIVAGYQVDGVAGGVYEMICGPGPFTRVVSDGFLLVLSSRSAPAEFEARLEQARRRGWAHGTIKRC